MQTKIKFPDNLFNGVLLHWNKTDEAKKDNEIKHLKRVIAGFKSWRTRRCN